MTDNTATPPLASRMASGAAWMVAWRMATRLLGVVSTLTLVRLLAPADFGLVMLATTFSSAVDSLSAVGIQDAVVREKSPTRDLYDTAFTMSGIRSLITGGLIAGAAWPLADFFAEPRVSGVLLALGAVTIAGALENIRVVDFRRNLAFHREFQLLLLPRLASIAASITVAAVWHSYWALVTGIVVNRGLQLVLGYLLAPYLPRLCLREWRNIVGFSVWTWLASVVAVVRDRSHTFVIGRMLGTPQLGLFAGGADFAGLTSTELVEPLCRVLFPGFAATRHAGGNLKEVYMQAVSVISLITMPASVGIAIVAGPMIALMFGPQWAGAVPVVAVLSIMGAVNVIAYISGTLFIASGLMASNFRIVLVTGLVRVLLLLLLVPRLGLLGGALAMLLAVMLDEALYLFIAARRLGFPAIELPLRLGRTILATATMAAVLSLAGVGWTAEPVLPAEPLRQLLIAVPLGVVAYTGALGSLWLLAGRPQGAERYALRILGSMAGRLLARVRR